MLGLKVCASHHAGARAPLLSSTVMSPKGFDFCLYFVSQVVEHEGTSSLHTALSEERGRALTLKEPPVPESFR